RPCRASPPGRRTLSLRPASRRRLGGLRPSCPYAQHPPRLPRGAALFGSHYPLMHDNETVVFRHIELLRGLTMRCRAATGESRLGAIWGAKLGAVVTVAAFVLGGCADLPVFHESAQFVGFATTPKEGEDFVKETHPDKTE